MKKILFATSEAVPFIKTGGLADVAGTLPKNFDKEKTGNVSGMLLYAKTDEIILPQNSYQISGNKIMVDTLNLDCDFIEIKKHLDNIVIKHFSI